MYNFGVPVQYMQNILYFILYAKYVIYNHKINGMDNSDCRGYLWCFNTRLYSVLYWLSLLQITITALYNLTI